MSHPGSLVLALLLALLAPAGGEAMHPVLCPDGAYRVDGPPLLPDAPGVTSDTVVIDHGTVAVGSACPAVPVRIRATPRGWVLGASWSECGTGARRVRLRALVAAGCAQMSGRLAVKRPRTRRRFTAQRCDDHLGCVTPCRTNDTCAATAYCTKATGDCDNDGTCQPRPTGCPDVVDPVCGCDGVTYSNACDAAGAGVNVRHAGACDTSCDVTRPCATGEFCELPPGVCASGLDAGTCVSVPEACPEFYQPVCGCDGRTYDNDCFRQAASVSLSSEGRCGCPIILCGPGTVPVDRDGDACDDACLAPCQTPCDCDTNPHIRFEVPCPLLCPNCGNYWDCEKGFCAERCGRIPPDRCRLCGGIAGIPCPAGQVCELPAGECQTADLQGECVAASGACTAHWVPVCGCDGQTYSNDCKRLKAGVQKAHEGACATPPPCRERAFGLCG